MENTLISTAMASISFEIEMARGMEVWYVWSRNVLKGWKIACETEMGIGMGNLREMEMV